MFKRTTINYLQKQINKTTVMAKIIRKQNYKNFMTGTGTRKMTDQDRRKKFEELCELANNFDLEKYCKKENKDPDDRWNEYYQIVLKYVQENNKLPTGYR
jgi:nicotinamide riboside kinase